MTNQNNDHKSEHRGLAVNISPSKNLVNQREVTAHVYEYTTQVSLDADLKSVCH